MIELKFGDIVAVGPQGSGFIPTEIAQKDVSISWDAGNPPGFLSVAPQHKVQYRSRPAVQVDDADPNAMHTLILYDQDAPYHKSQVAQRNSAERNPSDGFDEAVQQSSAKPNLSDDFHSVEIVQGSTPQDNSRAPYINYLVYNIPGNQASLGEVMFSYTSPELPPNSLPHRYVVDVYRQLGRIDPIKVDSRSSFPLEKFVADNRLTLVEHEMFTVGTSVRTVGTTSLPLTKPVSGKFFKADTSLSEQQQKYCRCVLKVAAKQPGECNTEKVWPDQRQGKTCYSPYKVCAKSTRTSYRHCGQEYNFETMSDEYIIAYAQLSGVSVPVPYNRNKMIAAIMAWKASKP